MRRFTPPWTVQALDGGFKIVDSNGQSLAYVYGHADERDAAIAKSLTLDEARRIASNIAKLPDLQVRPDDNIQAVSNLSDERHEAEDTMPNDEQ
jgi:K+/H+ antiporter YhaU regulatory subunit KhtT